MNQRSEFRIAVFAGDGIGGEVMAACLRILEEVNNTVGGFQLKFENYEAGAAHYRRTGVALSEKTFVQASEADAILLGAMGMPDVRYPDGREISPQLDFRERLELYAGVRPVRTFPGLPLPLADPRAKSLDFVLVRESTEGLFHSRSKVDLEGDQVARDTLQISRTGSERLFDFTFRLARKRKSNGYKGRVTCVDKANVLGSFVFFRKVFFERAKQFPDLECDCRYVDAVALNLVQRPWEFDVMVTENMFGDILSDLGAGLMGGLGMAPSADIGDNHAVFQPCHGSAPDIAGKGKANPTAMFLSAAMMLDWLSERHGNTMLAKAAKMLDSAVTGAFARGRLIPFEFGGTSGTEEITAAVIECLASSGETP
jgi:3-isopropylmalate dehydrogenase